MTTPLASPLHEVSTWTRKLSTWKHRSKKLPLIRIVVRSALRKWWQVHLKNIACDGLKCIGGENSVPKMSARVNVTSESALLPLWSDCPPRPSSTGAEPTMLQATWREQAHRARTPLRLTCFAAALTGPRGPSLVISFSAGHGTRVMSWRNVSAHHLRQFAPHSNNSMKLRIIKCC